MFQYCASSGKECWEQTPLQSPNLQMSKEEQIYKDQFHQEIHQITTLIIFFLNLIWSNAIHKISQTINNNFIGDKKSLLIAI